MIEKINGGAVINPTDDEGFVPPQQGTTYANEGVMLRPMLSPERGDVLSMLRGSVAPGAEISTEVHDWSESIFVLSGTATCTIRDGAPLTIQAGQLWHVDAHHDHLVQNLGDTDLNFLIMFGASAS